MSLNPYAAPASGSAEHRLVYWKIKWTYGAIVLGGAVCSLAGVTHFAITLAIVGAALMWIKNTWEFLPPRHRGATPTWMAVAFHCVPILNIAWMGIFNRRVADVLNDTLRPFSPKRVPNVLAVVTLIAPAVAAALWLVVRSSNADVSPTGPLAYLGVLALVGKAVYFGWMLRVDACCEEILRLQERASDFTIPA